MLMSDPPVCASLIGMGGVVKRELWESNPLAAAKPI